jgi:hypothetical protein
MLTLNSAEPKDIRSLINWLDGNGCLAREEAAYLRHHEDLSTIFPARDNALSQLEDWVEAKLIRFYAGFRNVSAKPLIRVGAY